MPPDPSTSKKGHPVNRSLHRVPRKQTLSHLLAGALLSTGLGAHAQSTTPADVAAPAAATVTVTSNINLLSQYRFRGIEQTWGKPAVQGGADATWASGWRFLFGRDGIVRAMRGPWREYLRADFHPADHGGAAGTAWLRDNAATFTLVGRAPQPAA